MGLKNGIMRRTAACLLSVFLLVALPAASAQTASISGTVKYDGLFSGPVIVKAVATNANIGSVRENQVLESKRKGSDR